MGCVGVPRRHRRRAGRHLTTAISPSPTATATATAIPVGNDPPDPPPPSSAARQIVSPRTSTRSLAPLDRDRPASQHRRPSLVDHGARRLPARVVAPELEPRRARRGGDERPVGRGVGIGLGRGGGEVLVAGAGVVDPGRAVAVGLDAVGPDPQERLPARAHHDDRGRARVGDVEARDPPGRELHRHAVERPFAALAAARSRRRARARTRCGPGRRRSRRRTGTGSTSAPVAARRRSPATTWARPGARGGGGGRTSPTPARA